MQKYLATIKYCSTCFSVKPPFALHIKSSLDGESSLREKKKQIYRNKFPDKTRQVGSYRIPVSGSVDLGCLFFF
jgi:hypothetical protein